MRDEDLLQIDEADVGRAHTGDVLDLGAAETNTKELSDELKTLLQVGLSVFPDSQ